MKYQHSGQYFFEREGGGTRFTHISHRREKIDFESSLPYSLPFAVRNSPLTSHF